MAVLRFESTEDIWDKNITDEQLQELKSLERKHGEPLDLFRFNESLHDKLWALPTLPFDEDRHVDFSIVSY